MKQNGSPVLVYAHSLPSEHGTSELHAAVRRPPGQPEIVSARQNPLAHVSLAVQAEPSGSIASEPPCPPAPPLPALPPVLLLVVDALLPVSLRSLPHAAAANT